MSTRPTAQQLAQARQMAETLAAYDKRLRDLERGPRLANASIHDQVIPIYDVDFQVRQTLGRQEDGTFTLVDQNGPPPPVPSVPVLEARPGTLVVTWDGTFADAVAAPADWDHVEVHVSTVSGYTPTDETQVATFNTLKGGSVTLALDPVPQYIVLQAVSTSRTESAPTGEVAGTPLPASTGEDGVQTFRENDPPIGLDADDDGALWYDTNDGNHPYRWDGGALAWISIQDATIGDAQATADAALDAATSDGLAPSTSPGPVMLSGIESMIARWAPITNADPVTYDVHISSTLGFTPDSTTLVGSTGSSQFTIRALPGPEPDPDTVDPRTLQYDVAYYIRIVARDVDGSAAPSAQGVGSVFQVTGTNLAADSVTAVNIVTGSLTGELFAASVIVGGTFKSGEAGQRVEWGAAGIQGYKPDGSLILNIPTDGSDALFDGEFIIRGATILGGISVQSDENESTADSVWTLMRGITSPSATPQIATTWDTIRPSTATLTAAQKTGPDLGTFDLDPSAVSHIEWKPSGSYWIIHQIRTGIGTRAWFFNPDGTPKDLFGTGVYFNDVKDWEIWSTVEIPAPAAKAGVYTMFRFIPNPGTDWYINGPLGFNHYTRTNTGGTPAVGTNGTDFFIAEIVSGDNLRITYHTPLSDSGGIPNLPAASTTYQSTAGYAASLCAVLFNATGTGGFDVTGSVHNRYATAQRAVAYSLRLVQQSGTGSGSLIPGGSGGWAAANQGIESWESPTSNVRGMGWDGANFWTYGGDGLLYKHTGERWDPSATSSLLWAQVTFKDTDAGGTGLHETKPGAWKSFTHKRRARIRFTPPSIPDNGGVDDPNAVQLYMARKATQPTNAEMWAQGSPVTAVFDLTTLATTGTNPPASNTFPAANAAKFRNDDDTLVIDGTGKILTKVHQFGANGNNLNTMRWGNFSGTSTGSGTLTITHGLGSTPATVLLGAQDFYARVTSTSSTTFTVEFRTPSTGATFNGPIHLFWLALA